MPKVTKDVNSQLETMADQVQKMADKLEEYEAKEQAQKKYEEAERKALDRFQKDTAKEEYEQELMTDLVDRIYQNKMKEHREQRSKIHFPVAQREGNLGRADRELLDLIMGRKSAVYRAKALSTGGVGSGAELVDGELSSQLRQDVENLSVIRGAFEFVNMPSNPFTYPLMVGDPTVNYVPEGTTIPASDPKTDDVILTAKKLAARTSVTYEEGEDAVIAVLPAVRQRLARSITDAQEASYIRGKSGSGEGHLKAFDGILNVSGLNTHTAGSDAEGGATDEIALNKARGKLGKWGARAQDLCWIVPIELYTQHIIHMSKLETLEKFGPQATLMTGEVGRLYGVPVLVSSGFAAPTTGTTLQSQKAILAHKSAVIGGDRRGFTVKTEDNPIDEIVDVIATSRTTIAVPFPEAIVDVTVFF